MTQIKESTRIILLRLRKYNLDKKSKHSKINNCEAMGDPADVLDRGKDGE
jgi:hypothetical protein